MQNSNTERIGIHAVGLAATDLKIIFRELPTSDQGIDGQFELTGSDGRANGRLIAVQIKAGQSWFEDDTEDAIVFRPSERHRILWLDHSLPVIVILCHPDSQECFCEIVSDETCYSTGEGWRIDIPKAKTLNSKEPLEAIAAPVAATSDFTVARTEDVSHGLARRISLDIVVHPTTKPMSKIQLGAIVRAAVRLGQKTDYARNKESAVAHAGKSADMVLGFVYLREVDRSAAQWVCRFQWTSRSIDERARYEGVPGEVDSDGLVIEWCLERPLAKLLDESRYDKGEYLRLVDRLLDKVPHVIGELSAFHAAGCPQEDAAAIAQLSEEFEQSWDDRKAAPAECQRLDQSLAELLAFIGNLGIIWGESSTYPARNAQQLSLVIERDLEKVITDIQFLRREAR